MSGRPWSHNSKYKQQDFFEHYQSEIEQGSIYDVKIGVFWKVLCKGNQMLFNKIFEGKRVKFIPYFGAYEVMKYKMNLENTKRLPFDWTEYNKTHNPDDLKYQLNRHTDGYRYFIAWDKIGRMFKNFGKYKLIYIPTIKRNLRDVAYANMECFIFNPSAAAEKSRQARERRQEKERSQNGIN